MAAPLAPKNDQDLFYGYLAEHIDEELPEALRASFLKVAAAPENASTVDTFKQKRGRLQLTMQGYYLNEREASRLRSLIEDSAVRETREAITIDQVGRWELIGDLRRRFSITVIAALLIIALVYFFTPSRLPPFDALSYLPQEALLLEDSPGSRLDLVSSSLEEVALFLASYPALGFQPSVLKPMGGGWAPDGAAVIDYETHKATVIQYFNPSFNESMFHFTYAGDLKSLKSSEMDTVRNLSYQSYVLPKELNIIAWQADDGLVNMMIGRRRPKELAGYAADGLK